MYSQTDRNGPPPCREVVAAAKDRLQRTSYLSLRKVSCEYDDGVLLLRGRLPSFYHKQLAQEAVAELEGVTQVVNQTEVIPSFA